MTNNPTEPGTYVGTSKLWSPILASRSYFTSYNGLRICLVGATHHTHGAIRSYFVVTLKFDKPSGSLLQRCPSDFAKVIQNIGWTKI